MLRVRININQTNILDLHAQRMEGFKGHNSVHNYDAFLVDETKGKMYIGHIRHTYSKGAAELAKKLLATYMKWEQT